MFFKKIAAMAVSGDHKDRRNKNRMSHPPIYTHPQIFILFSSSLDRLLESKQHLSAEVASSHIQVPISFPLMIR